IKFHAGSFIHPNRADIADDADDLVGHAETADEQGFADWIFVGINFFRAGLTDQANFLRVGGVMLIEFAPREQWNSPGLEITGGNIVARPIGAFLDRRNFVISARVERAIAAVQRNIAANSRVFDPWDIAQRVERLFCETLPRRRIHILGDGQCDRTGPKILGMESNILLSETNKTGFHSQNLWT